MSGTFLRSCFAALLFFSCSTEPPAGGSGTGGSGGSVDSGGGGGSGGAVSTEDALDDQGICRSTRSFENRGCPSSYDEALADRNLRCGTNLCAGTCGKWLVVQNSCTPSRGCTYDRDTRELVGVVFGDDVRINCGETSYEVVYGDGYHGCTFDSLDLDEDCRR